MPDEIPDDSPSPWLPCPECAGIWHRVTAVLERGEWTEPGIYEIDISEPPKVGAYITGNENPNIKPITCSDCGHSFSLQDVGYLAPSEVGDSDE